VSLGLRQARTSVVSSTAPRTIVSFITRVRCKTTAQVILAAVSISCLWRRETESLTGPVAFVSISRDVARFSREDSRGRYRTLRFRKTGSNDRLEVRPNFYYVLTRVARSANSRIHGRTSRRR
jgi:hypothetical protein